MITMSRGSSRDRYCEGMQMKIIIASIFLSLMLIGCAKDDQAVNPSIDPDAPAAPGTAKYRANEVEFHIEVLSAKYSLANVSASDVHPDGTASKWVHRYKGYIDTTTFMQSFCYISTSIDTVKIDSLVRARFTVGDGIITHPWCNSDIAMRIAEANGGADFRSRNPGCTVSALVGEAVVPDPRPEWNIQYTSKDDKTNLISFRIDALNGTVIRKYTP